MTAPARPAVRPGDRLVIRRGISAASGERVRVVADSNEPVWWDSMTRGWAVWCKPDEDTSSVAWRRVLRVEPAPGHAVQGVLL
jgi:hypothetical protein